MEERIAPLPRTYKVRGFEVQANPLAYADMDTQDWRTRLEALRQAHGSTSAKPDHTMSIVKIVLIAIALLAFGGFSFLMAFGVQALWNCIPPLFHGPLLTYWQAYAVYWALVIISGVLRSLSK
jgi:polyferredoxin